MIRGVKIGSVFQLDIERLFSQRIEVLKAEQLVASAEHLINVVIKVLYSSSTLRIL
jgi:hypothetical protein